MMRILVIEDEERLARLISRVLREDGYAPETASDGRSGLARALAGEFDLLVVDWMLPDLDGIEVIKRLRAAEMNVPVLMLTARRQVEDRVEGLDAGADDYLVKPFAFSELLARVRSLLRWPREQKQSGQLLAAGDVTLDPHRHVAWRGEEPVDLSPMFPHGGSTPIGTATLGQPPPWSFAPGGSATPRLSGFWALKKSVPPLPTAIPSSSGSSPVCSEARSTVPRRREGTSPRACAWWLSPRGGRASARTDRVY